MHVLLSKVLSQLSLIVFDHFLSQFDTTTIVFRDCLGFLCRRSGQFSSKERVASTPSTSAVPSNPVKWAVDG